MRILFQSTNWRVAPKSSSHAGRARRLGARRGKQCQTGGATPEDGAPRGRFTIEEHLRVQAQIEKRAYELWRDGACRQNNPLANWLAAEGEVLREFCLSRRLLGSACL